MISNVITITSSGENMEAALDQATKVAVYNNLSPKNTLHLRLLAEEMMGMMRSITGETKGKFWIEDKDGEYQLHLQVETVLSKEKRKELLKAAKSHKNEATRSLMGSLLEFFFRDVDEEIAAYNNPHLAAGTESSPNRPVTDWQWTLTRYQKNLNDIKEKQPEAAEAWDELEKSVVNNVADDVKVSIKGWQTEMIIIKKMTQEAK